MPDPNEERYVGHWQMYAGDFQEPIEIDFDQITMEGLDRRDERMWSILIGLIQRELADSP